MKLKSALSTALFGLLPAALIATPALAQKPVEVMIIGSYHMSNPNHDLVDSHADDVLAPKRQKQLKATIKALARFKPTEVDVEASPKRAARAYAKYRAGTLKPSRNEIVQLGFRLANQTGAKVHGIDEMMDFPFPAVQAYAKAHGMSAIIKTGLDKIHAEVNEDQHVIDTRPVSDILRRLSSPERAREDNDFYVTMLKIGHGTDQPGADLLAAWNRRNFHICANLIQHAKPGDRIVVIYGAGHVFLQRRCIKEMPGYTLVEANDYLPK